MKDIMDLSTQECITLLSGGVFGRVGLATSEGPEILPVNYAMFGDAIVFRTIPYGRLAEYAADREICFEVDHVDYDRHQGWSVLAIGRGKPVEDPEEVQLIREVWDPRPWATGQRILYIKLEWRQISGRRIGQEWTDEAMTPVSRTV
jgi:hypothetical protein